MNRRSYLKGCLVGVGSTLALASVGTAQLDEDQYETVVDVVDAGADPNGETSITQVLRENVGDDTLLRFPEGRYAMDEQLRLTGFDNVGFIGDGATIVPASYQEFDGPQYRLFRLGTAADPGRNLHFEGFEIDQTADQTGIRVISAEVENGLYVRNIHIDGVHDSGTWGPGLFNITDSDGEGYVDCFEAPDGGIHIDDTPNDDLWRGPTGINVNGNHAGTLVFENCILGGFPDNGLYSSSETGEVGVNGGSFRNSGTASVRLSGSQGVIRDATIAVDDNPSYADGQHPIRIDHGETFTVENVTIDVQEPNGDAIRVMDSVDDVLIEDSEIYIGEGGSSGIRIDPEMGGATISDVDLEIDGSAYAFRLLGQDAGEVTLEDVQVTGDASGSSIRDAIYCERNDCEFQGLSLEQTGSDQRRGLDLRGSGYLVSDSEFETTHTSITVSGADDVTIENTEARSDSGNSVRIIGDSGSVSLEDNTFPDDVRDDR